MDIRNLPDDAASILLGAAHGLDEMASDYELVNGSTLTGKAFRLGASALVLGAIPWVVLDVVANGVHRSRPSVDLDAPPSHVGTDPTWREFLER